MAEGIQFEISGNIVRDIEINKKKHQVHDGYKNGIYAITLLQLGVLSWVGHGKLRGILN